MSSNGINTSEINDNEFENLINNLTNNDLEIVSQNIFKTLNYGRDIFDEDKELKDFTDKQVGGVIYDTKTYVSADDALSHFINMCLQPGGKVHYNAVNSIAARGVILTLPPNAKSPYTSYSARTIVIPQIGNVRSIFIKFMLLSSNAEMNGNVGYTHDGTEVVTAQTIQQECASQQYVATSTANDDDDAGKYEMASPYIVYIAGRGGATTNRDPARRAGIDVLAPYSQQGTPTQVARSSAELSLLRILHGGENHGDGHRLRQPDWIPGGQNQSWGLFCNHLETGSQSAAGQGLQLMVGQSGMGPIIRAAKIRVGAIAMTMAVDADHQLIRNPEAHYQIIPIVYELLRCMAISGIVHHDCHPGNAFVSTIPVGRVRGRRVSYQAGVDSSGLRAVIIDWGRHGNILGVALQNNLKQLWRQGCQTGVSTLASEAAIRGILQTLWRQYITPHRNTLFTFTRGAPGVTAANFEPLVTPLAQYHRLCGIACATNKTLVQNYVWGPRGIPVPSVRDYSEYFRNRLVREGDGSAFHQLQAASGEDPMDVDTVKGGYTNKKNAI